MPGTRVRLPLLLCGALCALTTLVGPAASGEPYPEAGENREAVVDDFEVTVPVSIDPNGILTGHVTYDDGRSAVAFSTTADHPRVPGADERNRVLRLDFDVAEWAVFAHFFGDASQGGGAWVPADWRYYEGIGFWLYGQDSGVEFFLDIIDNRNPGSITDDAERFVYTFRDDFTGWKRFSFRFEDFVRKDIGNSAPADGFGRDRVHGWAIGTMFTGGPKTYFFDDLTLLGSVDDTPDHAAPGERAPRPGDPARPDDLSTAEAN